MNSRPTKACSGRAISTSLVARLVAGDGSCAPLKRSVGRLSIFMVPDPDALPAEFASRNVEFSEPLKDTDDGLRGFELKDCDGYVLFFGRPRL